MRLVLKRVGIPCLVIFLALSLDKPIWAGVATGWRPFSLGIQEGISNGTFSVEGLEFLQKGDVVAKVKVKNIGKDEARMALSVALFDGDKYLLTTVSFSPHLLRPRDEEHCSLEFSGSGEVFSQIKYYQMSIIRREEK